MAFSKIKDNKVEYFSNRKIRSIIMNRLNISSLEEWKKKYDLFKLKYRTYEKVFKKGKTKSVINQFYYYALHPNNEKSKHIMEQRAYNYKTIAKVENTKFYLKYNEEKLKEIKYRFKNFIKKHKQAKELVKKYGNNAFDLLKKLDKLSKDLKSKKGGTADFESAESQGS